LNSGLRACKVGALSLKPQLQPIFSGYFGDGGGLMNCLPGLALNLDLPDLSLPSSEVIGIATSAEPSRTISK
jgi:hypothetical protein